MASESGSALGLIITDRYLESHRLCYAINLRGRLFSFISHSVQLVLPNFASLEKVRRLDEILGTSAEPAKRPERATTPAENTEEYHRILSDLAAQLYTLKTGADNALRKVRKGADSIYSLLRHENPNLTTSAFTPDVAKRLFNTDQPAYPQLLAAHQAMSNDETHFATDPTRHVETATFVVRAYRDVLVVSQVANWIRERTVEYKSFLAKACKIISISRSLPNTTSPTKLDVQIDPELYFDNNDNWIIEFISAYATGRRLFIPRDLLALVPHVIKSSGLYPSEIVPNPNRDAAKLFLTEIGVWQPTERLPRQKDAGIIAEQIYRDQTATELLNDTNADIRHDFGDMSVYTIDDVSAHELDDGISIEETGSGIWLHIHIANPSAFIHPRSHIAELARLRQTTLYLPDAAYPMLPINDPNFATRGFSKNHDAMPTMTFSARLGTDGNIAEYKVRPGLVRNIKVLTYDEVDDSVFPDEKGKTDSWWTASYMKPDYHAEGKQFDSITPEIRSHLQMIENTIQTHRDWRKSQGALRLNFRGFSMQINPKPLDWESPVTTRNANSPSWKIPPTFIRGQAGIKFSLNNQSTRSRSLIEEMMIIAGRVAGLFSKTNNLAVPYRGLSMTIPQTLLNEARSAQPQGTKPLPIGISREIMATSGTWTLRQATTPQSHELLGISAEQGGYVQVTSPMRRYLDILTHWQFEAHFHSLPLPFSADILSGRGEESFLQASRRLFRRIFVSRLYTRHYASQAVQQLKADPFSIGSTHLEFRGGQPRLTGWLLDREVIGTGYTVLRTVMVKELGIAGLLKLRPDDRLPEFGVEFPVEILTVIETDASVIFQMHKD